VTPSENSEKDERPEPAERLLSPRLRKFAPLLLIAGAVVAGGMLLRHLPKERTVELRLDDAPSVTRVELAWASHGEQVGEPVQGGTWHFPSGSAPKSLRTLVRLPDGRYDLDVTVERSQGREAFHRVVTLGDSDRISIPLRP
jgi:hypothetical protein